MSKNKIQQQLEKEQAREEKLMRKSDHIRNNLLKVDPPINLVEWAEKNRIMPRTSPAPGLWVTSTVEPARGIMMMITDPDVANITLMTSAQILKTEAFLNLIGYYIDHQPKPIVFAMPTLSLAKTFSIERLMPMIKLSPKLRRLLDLERNSQFNKHFKNGSRIKIIWLGSAAETSSFSAWLVLIDELDRVEKIGKEGDVVKVLANRTGSFHKPKIATASTPTTQEESAILKEFKKGSQHIYNFNCIHCEQYHEPDWKNVKFDTEEVEPWKLAVYICPNCKTAWDEHDRQKAIQKGKWISRFPERKKHLSFHVNKLSATHIKISDLVEEFMEAFKTMHEGLDSKMQAFWNLSLGLPWENAVELPDHEKLFKLRSQKHEYKTCPENTIGISAAVDIQKDRAELLSMAWTDEGIAQILEYKVIKIDTSDLEELKKVTQYIKDASYNVKNIEGKKRRINLAFIDSGHETMNVYTITYRSNFIFPTKGIEIGNRIISESVLEKRGKLKDVRLFLLSTHHLKRQVYKVLNKTLNDQGTDQENENFVGKLLFPEHEKIDIDFFKSLTAEKYVRELNKRTNKFKGFWKKLDGRPNEVLDMISMNYAIAHHKKWRRNRKKDG